MTVRTLGSIRSSELQNGVVMSWSDGAGSAVYKTINLNPGYGLEVSVRSSGALSNAAISAGTGLRNLGEQEQNSRLAVWGDGIVLADGETEKFKKAKVKAPVVLRPGRPGVCRVSKTPISSISCDRGRGSTRFGSTASSSPNEVIPARNRSSTRCCGSSLVPSSGVFEGELLGAPKEYNLLQGIGGGVEKTLDFGIFGFISVFFLKALWWIYGLVGQLRHRHHPADGRYPDRALSR